MPWGSLENSRIASRPPRREMLGRLRDELRRELLVVDVPARREQQPVMAHDPGVLQLERALVAEGVAGGVHIHVGHPAARLCGRQHLGTEPVAVDVGAHPARHVQPDALAVGMGGDAVVLVDDEDVPLAVDALLPAVVSEGRLPALRLVAGDGAVHDERGVLGGGGLWRDGGDDASGDALGLGGGESGARLGHARQRCADGVLHLSRSESGLGSGDGGDLGFDYPLGPPLLTAPFGTGASPPWPHGLPPLHRWRRVPAPVPQARGCWPTPHARCPRPRRGTALDRRLRKQPEAGRAPR